MPYIKPSSRPAIDKLLAPLVEHLKSLPLEDQDGSINYSVTKIIKNIYPQKYFHYNRALGVLEAIKLELYRHIIGPYEDLKIKENGDLE